MILSEEEIQEERDDGAPIEVLEQYFEARGWACERTAEGEIVASATGSWAQYELRGVWRPEDQVLQFLAFPDIKVGPEKRSAIYEALSLIHEQLWLGRFGMWAVTVIRPSGRAVEGTRTVTTFSEAGPPPKLVVLAFKPQKLDEVAPELRKWLSAKTVIVSLLAGVEAQSLRQRFPGVGAIVRAI